MTLRTRLVFEMQKPLALAVIGGLSLSTLVTLYLVPAAYVALAGKSARATKQDPRQYHGDQDQS